MIKLADAARAEGLDHIPPERLRRWLIWRAAIPAKIGPDAGTG